jgi:hypothetical protein
MSRIDNDAAVRDRAYVLWELAGRPMGHEHEFWARASREIEGGGNGLDGSQRQEVGPENEDRNQLDGEPSAAEADKLRLAAQDSTSQTGQD